MTDAEMQHSGSGESHRDSVASSSAGKPKFEVKRVCTGAGARFSPPGLLRAAQMLIPCFFFTCCPVERRRSMGVGYRR